MTNCYNYNQLQKMLEDSLTYLGLNSLSMILCFWSPPPPRLTASYVKVASNTRPFSKLGGTTLNGGEEGGESNITEMCDSTQI